MRNPCKMLINVFELSGRCFEFVLIQRCEIHWTDKFHSLWVTLVSCKDFCMRGLFFCNVCRLFINIVVENFAILSIGLVALQRKYEISFYLNCLLILTAFSSWECSLNGCCSFQVTLNQFPNELRLAKLIEREQTFARITAVRPLFVHLWVKFSGCEWTFHWSSKQILPQKSISHAISINSNLNYKLLSANNNAALWELYPSMQAI